MSEVTMPEVTMPEVAIPEVALPAGLTIRRATTADIPFLAVVQYEASLPPLNHCFWEDLLQGTGTSALQFIEAMLRAEACNWGNASDCLILEESGKPVAAAAGYVPDPADYRPLRLSGLAAMAQELNWSEAVTAKFRDSYLQFLGDDCRPEFLTPQAAWIIENVAVLPEARGRGLGKVLLRALLAEGAQHYSHVGIMVINGNDVALRTYESLGFRPYQTFHAQYFKQKYSLDFPGITKLSLCFK